MKTHKKLLLAIACATTAFAAPLALAQPGPPPHHPGYHRPAPPAPRHHRHKVWVPAHWEHGHRVPGHYVWR